MTYSHSFSWDWLKQDHVNNSTHTHTHTQSSGSRPFTDSRCGVVASNPVHWRLTSLCLCSSKILSSCCCWRRPSSASSCTSSMTPSASPWYVTPHSTAAHSGRSSLLCSPSESLLFSSEQKQAASRWSRWRSRQEMICCSLLDVRIWPGERRCIITLTVWRKNKGKPYSYRVGWFNKINRLDRIYKLNYTL